MMDPADRDAIIDALRGLLTTDLREMVMREIRMFKPVTTLVDSGGEGITEVAGIGPMVAEELRTLTKERDMYKTAAENVKADREELRKEVREQAEKIAALEAELEVYKRGTGIGDIRESLETLLDKLGGRK